MKHLEPAPWSSPTAPSPHRASLAHTLVSSPPASRAPGHRLMSKAVAVALSFAMVLAAWLYPSSAPAPAVGLASDPTATQQEGSVPPQIEPATITRRAPAASDGLGEATAQRSAAALLPPSVPPMAPHTGDPEAPTTSVRDATATLKSPPERRASPGARALRTEPSPSHKVLDGRVIRTRL
jgi:hypothetical protein